MPAKKLGGPRDNRATANPENGPKLETLKWFAGVIGLTVGGLRGMYRANRVGPQIIKLGRSVKVNRDEVNRWLAAGAPDRATWEAMRSVAPSPAVA